jgi:hypothetical protein
VIFILVYYFVHFDNHRSWTSLNTEQRRT